MKRSIAYAAGSLAVVWMSLVFAAVELPSDSIYRLDVPLTTQDGHSARLPSFAGQVRIVSMFYASCSYVCPMTIATLKRIDADLSAAERTKLRVLLVSVDPERDTPQALARLAVERQVDTTRWSLAHAAAGDVRKIAAVLGVQYRQLADKEFNHSTVLALISPMGRIVAKNSSTGSLEPQFLAAVRKALANE